MPRKLPIFYSALILTLVNLLLRTVGTGFGVYLSRLIGPAGMGLMQLTMSVGSLALVAGIAGIRTATMYLTAEELGRRRDGQVVWVLSGCFCYSILMSTLVAAALYTFAPLIASQWIGNDQILGALRLYAAFLPCSCLCSVMVGYFTGANRILSLSAVEVGEQFLSMAITLAALKLWAGSDPVRACLAVILGSGAAGCITLVCLVLLRLQSRPAQGQAQSVSRRLMDTALPLGAADVLKSGITTAENLMVPKRLALHPATADPLASFGLVSGMVFPVLMFPACILFGLAELLIPELARCAAAGKPHRIHHLVRRGLQMALLWGCTVAGLQLLLAQPLCMALYKNDTAVSMLRCYGLLVPMLYCDAIVDAMTKGLGQQKVCVRYNILTSALDVGLLFVLLPRYGMAGYFLSFTLTHAVNFGLSLRRLLKITGLPLHLHRGLWALTALGIAVALADILHGTIPKIIAYFGVLLPLWYLLGILNRGTLHWLRGLVRCPQ